MEILIKGFLDGLRPEPRLTLSEWSDKYRNLSTISSNESGRYKTSKTPYLFEIMRHLSITSTVKEVVFMKASQVGASEAGINWMGYIMHITPSATLMVQPTIDMAKKFSKTRIQPMIDTAEKGVLTERVKAARSRDSGNTLLTKEFPGGVLILAGANSSSSLRSMPIKNLMLDEIDSYPVDLDEEGNPLELAKARQRTFEGNKKTFILSTPTVEGTSMIAREFEATDKRYYHVPCPECGLMQHLKFGQLRYTFNSNAKVAEDVYYECEDCKSKIAEWQKTTMLANGKWIATAPKNTNKDKVGYHINSLYSPVGWFSWKSICESYEAAKDDLPKEKTFINTVLGETFTEKGEAPEWQNLYNRRSSYKIGSIPNDVAVLTCGVDVQKNYLALEVVGWCKGKISYSIDYRIIDGETSGLSSPVWRKLSSVIDEVFKREDGSEMKISQVAIDAGYNSTIVYSFCQKYNTDRVIPVKGKDTLGSIIAYPKAVNFNRKGKAIGTTKVWNVGVSILKSELYGWLGLHRNDDGTYPNGYCHFPQYSEEYFKGITAEVVKLKKNRRGELKYEWVKEFERNEPLDVRNYARAAASKVGIDLWNEETWDKKKMENSGSITPKKAKVKREKKSIWQRD